MIAQKKNQKTSQWLLVIKAVATWTSMMTMTTTKRKRKLESKWEGFLSALILLFTDNSLIYFSLSTPVDQNMASLTLAASSGETGNSMPMPEGLIPVSNTG